MTFVAIFYLITICGLTGLGVLSLLVPADPNFRSDRLEMLFVVALTGVLLNGWIAFVLVELNRFSIWTLGAFALALFLFGYLLKFRKNRLSLSNQRFEAVHWEMGKNQYLPVLFEGAMLAVWLIVALFLFFRPHQQIWGAGDVGVYLNYAAHIAQSGGLGLIEPLLSDIPPSLYPYFLNPASGNAAGWASLTPSLNVQEMSGEIFLDFYHLHPTWQAVGWQIGGLSAALLITPFWGILSTLGFYFLLRQILPTSKLILALTTLAAFTISALQIWFVRYGTTEPLTQLLFMFGFLACCRWNQSDYKSWLWGMLAGVSFGMTFLARIDTFFIAIIPAVMLLLWLLGRFELRNVFIFFAPFLIFAAHGTMHATVFSPEYISRISTYMFLVASGPAFVLVITLTVVGLIGAGATWYWSEKLLPLFTPIQIVTSILLLVTFLYGWFVRPTVGNVFIYELNGITVEAWNHENWIRLGWYLTPFGVCVALAGVILMTYQKRWIHWYLLIPGIFYLLFYTWDLRSNGAQIYVMRRYVPLVLPFIMIASAVFWQSFSVIQFKSIKKLYPLLLMSWVLALGWGARGFVSRVDYVGMTTQVEQLANQLPPDSIVLLNQIDPVGVGDFLAMPLRMMHGHSTFVIHEFDQAGQEEMQKLIKKWQNKGENVYWIDLPPKEPYSIVHQFEQRGVNPVKLESNTLEVTYLHKPSQIIPIVWEFEIIELK